MYYFSNCDKMKEFEITEQSELTSFGYYTFYDCDALTELYVPKNVTELPGSNDGNIGFISKCEKLTTVTFAPDIQLTTIGETCFRECTALVNFVIPDTVTSIGENSIRQTGIVNSPFTPNSLCESMGDNAFYKCQSLVSFNFPKNITETQNCTANDGGMFDRCTALQTVIFATEGSKLQNIGGRTFYGCSSLDNVSLPEGVTSLGKYAFADCDGMTAIKLPNSLTTIDERVFQSCGSLAKVNFGAGLTNLTQSLIYMSYKLQYIYLPKTITSSAGSHALTSSDGTYANSVIFFNGTYEEALALKALVIANGAGNNQKINHDNFIEWNSDITDEQYVLMASENNANYLVYGYDTCEEFYGGIHDIPVDGDNKCCGICINCGAKEFFESPIHKDEWTFEGSYLTGFVATKACVYCEQTTETENVEALFISKGYSCTVVEGLISVVQGFDMNKPAIEKYQLLSGITLSYGVLATSTNKVADGNIDVINGAEGVTAVDFTGSNKSEFTRFEIKIADIPEENRSVGIYACAYVVATNDAAETTVYYISEDACTQSAIARTAAEILNENPI